LRCSKGFVTIQGLTTPNNDGAAAFLETLRLMLVHEARGPKGLIGEKAGNVDAVDLVRSRDRRVRSGQPV